MFKEVFGILLRVQAALEADLQSIGLVLGALQVEGQWVRSVAFMERLAGRQWNEVHVASAIASAQAAWLVVLLNSRTFVCT